MCVRASTNDVTARVAAVRLFSVLDNAARGHCRLVCKRWNEIGTREELWRDVVRARPSARTQRPSHTYGGAAQDASDCGAGR